MDKKKRSKNIIENYDYLANAASTTDCTGLMPTPADTEAEREAYNEIYHMNTPITQPKSKEK